MASSDYIRVASPLIIDCTGETVVEYAQSVIEIRCSLSAVLGERHAPLSGYSLPLSWPESVDYAVSSFTHEIAHTVWLNSPIVIEKSLKSGEMHFFLKKKL